MTEDHYSVWHNFCAPVIHIVALILKKGDRVRVATNHQWLPQRYGTIKQVENRSGNCFLVKFDSDELGMWHDDDGDPVLRLGERDLVAVDRPPHVSSLRTNNVATKPGR